MDQDYPFQVVFNVDSEGKLATDFNWDIEYSPNDIATFMGQILEKICCGQLKEQICAGLRVYGIANNCSDITELIRADFIIRTNKTTGKEVIIKPSEIFARKSS